MAFNTLYELLHESVRKFPNNIAFSLWQGDAYTYSQVEQKVEEVQQTLLGAGLKPGDKIALLSSSMPNWSISYFAITTAGYIVVPILPDFTTADIDHILEHSESKALFVSDKLFTKVSKESLERMNIVVRTKNLGIMSQRVKAQGERKIPQRDDLAALLYTSGTTSAPKGVMLTHYNIASQAFLIEPLFICKPDDVLLSVLPLAHTYECTVGMVYPFTFGSHMVYLDKMPTITILKQVLSSLHPSIMLVVPLIIEKIYKQQVVGTFTRNATLSWLYSKECCRKIIHLIVGSKLKKFFGGNMRFMGIGGAKLDTLAERFLYEAKFPYAIGYGMTETAPLIAGAVGRSGRQGVKVGSTGPVLKGIEYRLDNINPETQQGELVVKTPSQCVGYFKNEEATKALFTQDGFLRTGDLGCFDAEGRLYIKGRLKNMILGPSGENIYPEDIESVLNSHQLIAESVVTEHEGKLIARVYFDSTKLEKRFQDLVKQLNIKKTEMEAEWEKFSKQTISDIKEYVNNRVQRSFRIDEVIEEKNEFIKTPTKKIKRFLYGDKKN